VPSAGGGEPQPPRLAEILAKYAPERVSPLAAQVIRALVSCRTPARGGRREVCDHCGTLRDVYDSCGNRHCPTCQSLETARWLERQQACLLPVPYFHVVFTIPAVLHPLFLATRRESCGVLLAAAAETLLDVARRRLGAVPGVLVVLHTWNQTLGFHPHVHCLVSGGGLRLDRQAWVPTSQSFLFPGRILRQVFAAKLRHKLSDTAAKGRLAHSLSATRRLLWLSKRTPWVVYAKAPFAGPRQVVAYLGRYTHRIAIGNERILACDQGSVTFAYRDRRHGNQRSLLTIPAPDFVRRFLLHLVPRRFVRVRHYGILANPVRANLLPLCRRLLRAPQPALSAPQPWYDLVETLTGADPRRCTRCQQGYFVKLRDLPRDPLWQLTHVRSPC
jgi:hypothetical protein